MNNIFRVLVRAVAAASVIATFSGSLFVVNSFGKGHKGVTSNGHGYQQLGGKQNSAVDSQRKERIHRQVWRSFLERQLSKNHHEWAQKDRNTWTLTEKGKEKLEGLAEFELGSMNLQPAKGSEEKRQDASMDGEVVIDGEALSERAKKLSELKLEQAEKQQVVRQLQDEVVLEEAIKGLTKEAKREIAAQLIQDLKPVRNSRTKERLMIAGVSVIFATVFGLIVTGELVTHYKDLHKQGK